MKVEKIPNGYRIYCPACMIFHEPNNNWDFNGDFERPTFSPSLSVTWQWGWDKVEHRCHSFVRDGHIEFLADCTHSMAGQIIPLPDIEGKAMKFPCD